MRKIWNNEKIYDVKNTLDEKFASLFSTIKYYFKTKKLSSIYPLGGGILLLILVLTISFSLANLTPARSVEIFSENASYQDGEDGAWKVTKSAEWIEENVANINFKIESNLGGNLMSKSDYIFVVEDSSRYQNNSLDNLNLLFEGISTMLYAAVDLNESNQFSVVTFNSTYNILTDFTRDVDSMLNFLPTMQGNTNYYQALKGIDEVLSDYTKEADKDCTVVFVTLGAPNEQTPDEIAYTKQLRSKYPYVKINSIGAFFSDIDSTTSLHSISDNVSFVSEDDLSFENEESLMKLMFVALGFNKYINFTIEDVINSEYFEVLEASSNIGEVLIDTIGDNTKVFWNLKDGYYSTSTEELNVKVKLKDEYVGVDDKLMFQTNIQERITSSILDMSANLITEEVTSSLTPVLSNSYLVSYDGNAPEDCSVQNVPDAQNHKPFSTVEIDEETPTCSGYKFKGWKFVEDNITNMGDDYFIMPSSDVTLKAEWSKVSIKKSMKGDVTELGSLWAMIASNSVPDNIASEYVTSSTGINFGQIASDTNGKGTYMMSSTAKDEFPIYYYRGAVDNNNVRFANFCWKIVRTTDTGGVKLIYNGLPDENGGCTNTTGAETTIGQSLFFDLNQIGAEDIISGMLLNIRGNFGSGREIGYMYGNKEHYTSLVNSWLGVFASLTGINSLDGSYYVSDDVSYDETTDTYTLINPRLVDFYYNLGGGNNMATGYICPTTETTSCSEVWVVQSRVMWSSYNVGKFLGGDKLPVPRSEINNFKFKFAKDVKYSNGVYNLIDLYDVSAEDLGNLDPTARSEYPYVCLNGTESCEMVWFYSSELNVYYTLMDGEDFDDVVDYITSGSPNNVDSEIKKYIDDWYRNNMINYNSYLEDTIWCNDRSVYGKNITAPEISDVPLEFVFGATGRLVSSNPTPSVSCALGDSFTVDPIYKNGVRVGNGALTYPVATLTSDEAVLAGDGMTQNTTGYLYNGVSWNLLTPLGIMMGIPLHVAIMDGQFGVSLIAEEPPYVRPSVSLKFGIKATTGIGTSDDPFVIE